MGVEQTWSTRLTSTGPNSVELHHRDPHEACFPRSARLPGLTGSQRVRGSNPLSSTLAMTVARIEFPQVKVLLARRSRSPQDRLFTGSISYLEQIWSTASTGLEMLSTAAPDFRPGSSLLV